MRERDRHNRFALATTLVLGITLSFRALSGAPVHTRDLSETSLEDLMQLEVTSAARRPQTLSKTAAAVFVITAEDIRRSGALNIAEVLRLAPGIQVARIDSLRYAISSRGFNGEFSNKVMVLIDGRSVYATGTGKVGWDMVDTDLDSIERIEVIGGPAGAVWGANALNGVINIITRSANETTGSTAEIGTGRADQLLTSFRHGAKKGKVAYRIYGKSLRSNPLGEDTDVAAGTSAISSRAGFRIDAGERGGDILTLTGDLYDNRGGMNTFQSLQGLVKDVPSDDSRSWGGHLYGRWTRQHSNGSSQFQAYFDRQYSDTPALKPRINTVDVEYQREFTGLDGHSLLAGGGVRFVAHSYPFLFGPELSKNQNYGLANAFLQDDITLVEDRLVLTAGAKLERNSLSPATLQPTVRLAWTPASTQTIWSALSHSNRTPSRFEEDADLIAGYTPTPLGLVANRFMGRRDLAPETVTSIEAGYRIQPRKSISIDTALFHNDYSGLIGVGSDVTYAFSNDGRIFASKRLENAYAARTYGAELSTGWSPRDNLRISGTYARLNLETKAGNQIFPRDPHGRSPLNQGNFGLHYTPSQRHRLDIELYCVGRLSADAIPAYQRLDLHWEWKLTESLTLSVLGRDLLRPQHYEFLPDGTAGPSPLKRGASIKLRWDF